jgi:hypothetical protein
MPTEKFDVWPNRPRLPLGDGWKGTCTAPPHQGVRPGDYELREFCNFGYASRCPRLPEKRLWDAVRFSVSRERDGQVVIYFVCEVDHRPGEHGALEYDCATAAWTAPHRDARVQKMAQCYLESYLERKGRPVHPGKPSS